MSELQRIVLLKAAQSVDTQHADQRAAGPKDAKQLRQRQSQIRPKVEWAAVEGFVEVVGHKRHVRQSTGMYFHL